MHWPANSIVTEQQSTYWDPLTQRGVLLLHLNHQLKDEITIEYGATQILGHFLSEPVMITSNQEGNQKNGDIQGHLCPTLEDLGLIACYIKDTELSLLVIYLLPAAHSLWMWFYLHLHPPSPLHPWSFGPVSWRKKMSDDILIHISLYAILGVVRVSLFLTPRCSLIWGIFWSRESEEVWHERIFLVIKHAGTDTTFSAATVSKQSGTVETHTPLSATL